MKKRKAMLAVLLMCIAVSCNISYAQDVSSWSDLKTNLEEGNSDVTLNSEISANNPFIEIGDYDNPSPTNHNLNLNSNTVTGTEFSSAAFFVHEPLNIENGTFKNFNNKGTNTEEFDMSTQELGGVIYNENAKSTINQVTFETNQAKYGGAFTNLGTSVLGRTANSNLTITDSSFTSNKATLVGGAIFNAAMQVTNYDEDAGTGDFNPILSNPNTVVNIIAKEKDVIFKGNTATKAGGAIFNLATVNIEAESGKKVQFETNTDSIYNAGILNIKKGETVVNSSITDEKIQLELNDKQFTIGNSGITNIGGENAATLTLGESATITQKEINVKNQGVLNAKNSANTITGALKIETGGSANIDAGVLTSEAKNDGTLALFGGTLNQNITGEGVTNIGDESEDAAVTLGESATITQKEINVKKQGTLNAKNSANKITGALKIETGGSANVDAGVLTSEVENKGTISLYNKSTLNQNIKGEGGTTKIEGEVTNEATISQNVEITKSNGNLTSSADNITGTVNNGGTYNITGGTIAQVISGDGTVNITGDVISNADNTLTGTVNLNEGAKLSIGESGDLFNEASVLNAKNGSTISLLNSKEDSSILANLKVETDESINLEVDWNDKIASTSDNIKGNITLSKIDMTKKGSEEYTVSSEIKDKISLSDKAELVGGDNINYLSYNSSDGKLTAAKVDSLKAAVEKAQSDGSGVYQMSGDEEVTEEGLGALGSSANLTVNGGGNSIKGNKQDGITVESGSTLSLTNMKDVDGFKDETAITNNGGTVNLSDVTLNDKITGTGETNITGDTTLNSAIEGNTLNLNEGTLTLGESADISNAESFVANGGALSLQNSAIQDTNLGKFTLEQDMNLSLDANFAEGTMDKISATEFTANGHNINISNINILAPTTAQSFSISPISESMDSALRKQLAEAVKYTGGEMVYSPIYKYNAIYDPETAMLNFTRGGNGYNSVNPSIMAAPVAAQLGGYLNQLNSYDEAFRNMDMYMLMTKSQRQALKNKNKYAAADSNLVFDPTNTPYDNTSAWFRPYATFENVKLKGGPKVSNVAWGSFFGADSELMELGHGWDGMFGAYLGYNGSHQAYDGVSVYQNGATLGLVGMAYKDNFFAGLTANVGSNIANADTMYGSEDFTLLMSGIAAKTGYNWELADGKFIIQPNYMMSYSFVNTFDYTNSAGVRINSDPLNAITFEPGVKFIGNLNNGWQPYAGVSVVWNVMDKTKFQASDATLPELSVKPFVKYGIGIRKTWGERLVGFFQTFFTNGGRNGVGLQAGVRWTLGNAEPKHANSTGEKKYIAKK